MLLSSEKDSDHRIIGDLMPDGYTFRHAPYTHQKAGGVCILYCDTLKTQLIQNMTLASGGKSVCVAIIYQLHSTRKNSLSSSDCFRVFSEFVDSCHEQWPAVDIR